MRIKSLVSAIMMVIVVLMGVTGCGGTPEKVGEDKTATTSQPVVVVSQGKAITDQDTDASVTAYREMLKKIEAPLDNIYENTDLAVNGWRFFYQNNEYGSHQSAMAISPTGEAILMNNDSATNPIRELIETNKGDLAGVSKRILWLAEDGATFVDKATVASQYKDVVTDPILKTDDSGALVLEFWAILRDSTEPIQYVATAPVSGQPLVQYKMITE